MRDEVFCFRKKMKIFLLGLLATAAAGQPPAGRAARADSATAALIQHFYNPGGQYFNNGHPADTTFHYWPQAHALEVLTDAYERTRSAHYLHLMQQWRNGVPRKNGNTFLNEYYDDMEWNALATLRAFRATGDSAWLHITLKLWQDIQTAWNPQQGGGMAWRKTQPGYKNTPANAPAAILATRLYGLLHRPDDLQWARKIYDWQKTHLVDTTTGLVFDGVNRQGDGKTDRDWLFTYCQGVYIGAGLELFLATRQKTYLDDALRTAHYATTSPRFVTDGVLKETGQGDGGLFKGILVRYLALLARQPAAPAAVRASLRDFLVHNARVLRQQGTAPNALLFNDNWRQPPGPVTGLTAQLSGAILFEALCTLP